MRDALSILEETEARLAPLAVARNLAWWDSQIEATEENGERRVHADLAWSDALADRELFSLVDAARERAANGGDIDRRLELLRNLMLTHQIPDDLRSRIVELETSVDLRFARHRGVVRGEEVDDVAIRRILRRSDDAEERRDAWNASKTVGAEVADDVRELARLRNQAARELGYRDWFALSLATDELDEDRLAETLAEADRATAIPFAAWKGALDARLAERFGCPVSDLRPWHYADPFFQEAPPDGAVDLDPMFDGRDIVALAQRTFDGIGLETESILERSDLYPRAGKCQHAFCIDVDRAGDVRVLANLDETHESADTMLHELGHGVYDLCLDEDLPWLCKTTHLVATEASALFFGALTGKREWLDLVLGLSAAEGAQLESRLRAARAAELVVFTRWVLVMNAFERALYADPNGDLDTLWWELVSRFQRVTPPDARASPDWAAKIHIAVAPVYYHTYLYGNIVALQLDSALVGALGVVVDRPEAGALIRERLFGPGESVRWDRLVEQASGTPLDVGFLEREAARAQP